MSGNAPTETAYLQGKRHKCPHSDTIPERFGLRCIAQDRTGADTPGSRSLKRPGKQQTPG